MFQSIRLATFVVLCQLAVAAVAAEKKTVLKACLSDVAASPLTYPDREGISQYLARHAAEAIGIGIDFIVEPRKRCIDNVARGMYQLLLVSANTPSLREQFAYPMSGESVDPRRTAGPPQMATLISASKSLVRWDGRVLSGIRDPVLVKAGDAAVVDWVKTNHYPYFEVRSVTQILSMLQSGHSEVAILRDDELLKLRADSRAAAELTVHDVPAFKVDMYISANKEFSSQNAALMERFWNEVANIQSRPVWKTLEPRFY